LLKRELLFPISVHALHLTACDAPYSCSNELVQYMCEHEENDSYMEVQKCAYLKYTKEHIVTHKHGLPFSLLIPSQTPLLHYNSQASTSAEPVGATVAEEETVEERTAAGLEEAVSEVEETTTAAVVEEEETETA